MVWIPQQLRMEISLFDPNLIKAPILLLQRFKWLFYTKRSSNVNLILQGIHTALRAMETKCEHYCQLCYPKRSIRISIHSWNDQIGFWSFFRDQGLTWVLSWQWFCQNPWDFQVFIQGFERPSLILHWAVWF